jgi:hypothetical protein
MAGMRRALDGGFVVDDERDRIDRAAVHAYLSEEAYWALGRGRAVMDELIETAARLQVPLEVAHTRLWSRQWMPMPGEAFAVIEYVKHERDYPVWLDWAPHAIAALAHAMPNARSEKLRSAISIGEGKCNSFTVWGDGWNYCPSSGETVPPMLLMVADFIEKLHLGLHERAKYWKTRYDFNRRVYRALFDESRSAYAPQSTFRS